MLQSDLWLLVGRWNEWLPRCRPICRSKIAGAVRYILPGVAVEIVSDQDRVLPLEEVGNVRIRSDYGVKEYLDDQNRTTQAFRNGWFYPGDRGHFTRDNLLVIGEKVQNVRTADSMEAKFKRIEDALSKHTNVLQCAVLAVADASGTAELCASVVPRSYFDGEAFRSYCKAHLPSDLVPARFVALSSLPKLKMAISIAPSCCCSAQEQDKINLY